MSRLRVLGRDNAGIHAIELRSLFVLSLPRSLSSLLYVAAAGAIGLAEPAWTSDGEILNRDRVPRRLQGLAPADERFTLLGSAPDVFASMTSYLDRAALRQGFAYKDVVQPFVIGGWEGLGDFRGAQGAPQRGGGRLHDAEAAVALSRARRERLRRASVGARRGARARRGGARRAAGRDGRVRRRGPRPRRRSSSRSAGSIPTRRSRRSATSTAASPGRAGGSRPSGAARSSSAGSSGSSRRCGSGCASTIRARKSPRRCPRRLRPAPDGAQTRNAASATPRRRASAGRSAPR